MWNEVAISHIHHRIGWYSSTGPIGFHQPLRRKWVDHFLAADLIRTDLQTYIEVLSFCNIDIAVYMQLPPLWNTTVLLKMKLFYARIVVLLLYIKYTGGNSAYDPTVKVPEVHVLEEPFSAFLQVVVFLTIVGFFWLFCRLCQFACSVISFFV